MDKKKLIYILTGFMGVMVAIIIVVAIVNWLGGKKLSYSQVEDKMITAAQSYYSSNENLLPQLEGSSVTVDTSTLVNGKYLSQVSDMVPEGVDCTGKVIVTKNGTRYLYSPMLSCGDDYQTKKFVDVITANNPIVTEGDGLYLIGNVNKFKGEYINNYVKIDEFLWRILDIDSEGYLRLIYVDKATEDMEETYVWDDRYNVDKDGNIGINNYDLSRIKQSLLMLEQGNVYLSEDAKAKMAYRNICVGKRSGSNLEFNIDEECEIVISNQLFGLPYAIDYVVASTDANCNDLDDRSCENYNYLMNSSLSSWTLNGQKEKSYRVFSVSRAGYSISDASADKALRPTVYLSNNVLFESGEGTKGNPYIIK
ncbi:MAG: hypothetical protein E7173_01520 [Firmicutes bacterium]|nr:hypothetical protein [Bacillota bacterium]